MARAKHVEPVRVLMNRTIVIFLVAAAITGTAVGAAIFTRLTWPSAFVLGCSVIAMGGFAFALKPVIVKALEKSLGQ